MKNTKDRDVWGLIQAFNSQRDCYRRRQAVRAILAQKYAKMQKSAFAFFRGTCHLSTQDKITLKAGKISLAQLEKLIETMAQVTAAGHLNSGSKLGVTIERDLIAFGNRLDWQKEVSIYTSKYAQQVQRDYRDFCQATQDL